MYSQPKLHLCLQLTPSLSPLSHPLHTHTHTHTHTRPYRHSPEGRIEFQQIADVCCVTALSTASQGHSAVSPRFLWHFNLVVCPEATRKAQRDIFSTIVGWFLTDFPASKVGGTTGVGAVAGRLVDAMVSLHESVSKTLRPSASRMHYLFSMHDIFRVLRGILLHSQAVVDRPSDLLRLWAHETRRVYEDRLSSQVGIIFITYFSLY